MKLNRMFINISTAENIVDLQNFKLDRNHRINRNKFVIVKCIENCTVIKISDQLGEGRHFRYHLFQWLRMSLHWVVQYFST